MPVNLYNKDGKLVLRFTSNIQLSEFLGCHKTTVGAYLKSGKLYKNMYYIKKRIIKESELVGGFFTEHSSVPFVFFFLSEYSSIVLFSSLTAVLFLGGYNLPSLDFLYYIIVEVKELSNSLISLITGLPLASSLGMEGAFDSILLFFNNIKNYGEASNAHTDLISDIQNSTTFLFISSGAFVLGLKTCFTASLFVGARALLARYKYSDLINLCWLGLLPLVIALTLFFPALLIQDFIIYSIILLS